MTTYKRIKGNYNITTLNGNTEVTVTTKNVLVNANVSATGNVIGNYFFGDGSQLTNLPAGNYSNANVAAYLPTYSGNISGSFLSTTGNIVSSGYFLGNGSQLTGLPATYSNANVATYLADFGSNAISTTGNVTAGYFVGDGSLLTNLPIPGVYGNANVATFLANFGSNAISTTGNVTANYLFGNGSQLTGINANTNLIVNGNSWANIPSADGNLIINTSGNTWTFDTSGTLTLPNGATLADRPGNAISIGVNAGNNTQGIDTIAIGTNAGETAQGQSSTAIGSGAGNQNQGANAVAVGFSAGGNAQGESSVAVGYLAGNESQGQETVAVGVSAGANNQSLGATAVGPAAGAESQGLYAVAMGYFAGLENQGQYSVAVGQGAGRQNQANNSIILNATGASLNQTTANTFTVAPIRNDVANTGQILFYNTTSKEITYGNTISVTGNISGNYYSGNGRQLTGQGMSYKITAANSLSYLVNGGYANTTINLTRGQTYLFEVAAPSHPLWIKTDPIIGTGNAYSTGVTNNGAGNGTVQFSVPFDAPGTLYYQCQFHVGMYGILNITDGTSIQSGNSNVRVFNNGNVSVSVANTANTAIFTTNNLLVSTGISATGNITGNNLISGGTVSAAGNISGNYFIGDGSQLVNLPVGNYSNANVAAYMPNYLPTYSGNLASGNLSVTGQSNVTGNVNVYYQSRINGTVNGQLNGLVNGVNTTYGTWDFGFIAANTYNNPIQWIFAQTSAGNVNMGTITAPASLNIDIGTIF